MKGTQKSQAPEEKPAPLLLANKGAEQPLVIQAREETAKGGHQGKQNAPKITFPTLLLTQTEAVLCAHPLLRSALPLQANPDSHPSNLFLLLAFSVSFLPTSFPQSFPSLGLLGTAIPTLTPCLHAGGRAPPGSRTPSWGDPRAAHKAAALTQCSPTPCFEACSFLPFQIQETPSFSFASLFFPPFFPSFDSVSTPRFTRFFFSPFPFFPTPLPFFFLFKFFF